MVKPEFEEVGEFVGELFKSILEGLKLSGKMEITLSQL
jgi:hypothetical protein